MSTCAIKKEIIVPSRKSVIKYTCRVKYSFKLKIKTKTISQGWFQKNKIILEIARFPLKKLNFLRTMNNKEYHLHTFCHRRISTLWFASSHLSAQTRTIVEFNI